tara:strand:+ start:1519 stop:2136 length:618 start_codon:yes stop_codon:yes gene_type:complete
MTKYTLNYNLAAILLWEAYKTVDIGTETAPRAGYSRNILDPVAAIPGGKAQMTFDDVKIKRGEKGFKKGKYTKDPKNKRWAPKEKTEPTQTDLSPDYFDNKPDKMTTALVPYKPEAPDADVKKPAAPGPKKPKAKFGPEALYKTGDSDYTFMTAFDPDRFKKISGAVQTARGLDDMNQPVKKPKTFDIPKVEGFRPTLTSILIGS